MTEKPDLESLLSAIIESIPDAEDRNLVEIYFKNPILLSGAATKKAVEILKEKYPEVYEKIRPKKTSYKKAWLIAGVTAAIIGAYVLGDINFTSKKQDPAESSQKIEQLETENKKLYNNYSELRKHVSAMEERLGDYGTKNGMLDDEVNAVLLLVNKDTAEFARERRQYAATIEENIKTINTLRQERDAAQTGKKKLEEETAQQKTSLAAAETKTRTLEEQARQLLETQTQLNTRIKKIQGDYDVIAREKEELKTTVQRYEEQLKNYQSRNGTLEQEVQRTKKIIDDYVGQIKKIEEASERLRQEKSELAKANARLDQMLFTGLTIYHRITGKEYHYLDFPFYYQDGADARRVIQSEKYYMTEETAKKLNAAEILSAGDFNLSFSRLWIKVEGPASSKKYTLISEDSNGTEIRKKTINEQAVVEFIKSVLLAHMEDRK